MSRKNDKIIKEEEPLEVRVSDLKTKVVDRLAVDLVKKNQEQYLDPFALIFLIQSLRSKVKSLLEQLRNNKIPVVYSPSLIRPL